MTGGPVMLSVVAVPNVPPGEIGAAFTRTAPTGKPLLLTTPEIEPPVTTLVVTVAELFAGFGSLVSDVTLAMFAIVPLAAAVTLTFSVIVAFEPLGMLPRLQLTVPALPNGGGVAVPHVALPPEKGGPARRASGTTTLRSRSGPALAPLGV